MESPNFLAGLPDPVLLRIIQSAPPNASTNHNEVLVFTPLSCLFRGIILESSLYGKDISLVAGPNIVSLDKSDDLHRALEACGKVFQSLKVFSDYAGEFKVKDVEMLDNLYKNGSLLELNFDYTENVECLELPIEVIKVMGHRFTRLKFRSVYGNMGNALKKSIFDMISHSINQLKGLEYDDTVLEPLDQIWELLGSRLEQLNVTLRGNAKEKENQWKRFMDKVQLNCPNLKHIFLKNPLDDPKVTEEDWIKFFCSYGDKLLKANIAMLKNDISEESCKLISEMCPNLRCEWVEDRHQFGRIGAFGLSLKSLELKVSDSTDLRPLVGAMGNCWHLEELFLSIEGCSDYFFQQFFQLSFNFLRKLVIFSITSKKHMEVLTSQIRSLEELHLGLLDTTGVGLLRNIISANESLKHLYVKEFCADLGSARDDETLSFFNDIVVNCRPLREITVDMSERHLPDFQRSSDFDDRVCRLKIPHTSYRFIFENHDIRSRKPLPTNRECSHEWNWIRNSRKRKANTKAMRPRFKKVKSERDDKDSNLKVELGNYKEIAKHLNHVLFVEKSKRNRTENDLLVLNNLRTELTEQKKQAVGAHNEIESHKKEKKRLELELSAQKSTADLENLSLKKANKDLVKFNGVLTEMLDKTQNLERTLQEENEKLLLDYQSTEKELDKYRSALKDEKTKIGNLEKARKREIEELKNRLFQQKEKSVQDRALHASLKEEAENNKRDLMVQKMKACAEKKNAENSNQVMKEMAAKTQIQERIHQEYRKKVDKDLKTKEFEINRLKTALRGEMEQRENTERESEAMKGKMKELEKRVAQQNEKSRQDLAKQKKEMKDILVGLEGMQKKTEGMRKESERYKEETKQAKRELSEEKFKMYLEQADLNEKKSKIERANDTLSELIVKSEAASRALEVKKKKMEEEYDTKRREMEREKKELEKRMEEEKKKEINRYSSLIDKNISVGKQLVEQNEKAIGELEAEREKMEKVSQSLLEEKEKTERLNEKMDKVSKELFEEKDKTEKMESLSRSLLKLARKK